MKITKRVSSHLIVFTLASLTLLSLLALSAGRSARAIVTSRGHASGAVPRPAAAAPPAQSLTQPTTIGVYRPASSTFYLRNSSTAGLADFIISFGQLGDLPLVSDWNGDGVDTIGVYRPSNRTFYLRNSHTPGPVDITVTFGQLGDLPVVGDWDGNGTRTIGVFHLSDQIFHLRNSNAAGPDDLSFRLDESRALDVPVSGRWVSPPNQAPVVAAGPDQTITLPTNTVNLSGTVSDDGRPYVVMVGYDDRVTRIDLNANIPMQVARARHRQQRHVRLQR
jgi:hypothetical protein